MKKSTVVWYGRSFEGRWKGFIQVHQTEFDIKLRKLALYRLQCQRVLPNWISPANVSIIVSARHWPTFHPVQPSWSRKWELYTTCHVTSLRERWTQWLGRFLINISLLSTFNPQHSTHSLHWYHHHYGYCKRVANKSLFLGMNPHLNCLGWLHIAIVCNCNHMDLKC